MINQLLPCPCCGSKPRMSNGPLIPYQVACENPNCQLSGRISGDEQKAINSWNTRHVPEGMVLVSVEYLNIISAHLGMTNGYAKHVYQNGGVGDYGDLISYAKKLLGSKAAQEEVCSQ